MGLNAAWGRGPDQRGADAWAGIKAANQFNSAAPDGNAYVLIKIKASINSVVDDQAIRLSQYSFTPYSSDNVEYDSALVVTPDPELGWVCLRRRNHGGVRGVSGQQNGRQPKACV